MSTMKMCLLECVGLCRRGWMAQILICDRQRRSGYIYENVEKKSTDLGVYSESSEEDSLLRGGVVLNTIERSVLPRQAEPDLGRECLRAGPEYARELIAAGRGPHGNSSIFIPDEALGGLYGCRRSCGTRRRMRSVYK